MKNNMRKKAAARKYALLSVCSVCCFLLIWQFSTDVFHFFDPTTLPSPVTVLQTFFDKFTNTKPDGATLQVHTLHLRWLFQPLFSACRVLSRPVR